MRKVKQVKQLEQSKQARKQRSEVKGVTGKGVTGWLYRALWIIIRIGVFTLRKAGIRECFNQRNNSIWLRFYQGHSGYWVENTTEGQREAVLPAVQSWADHLTSVYLVVLLFRGTWRELFLSPNLMLNSIILSWLFPLSFLQKVIIYISCKLDLSPKL